VSNIVYVLFESVAYEGDNILDVYSTQEAADKAAKKCEADNCMPLSCSFRVYPMEVIDE
jgi:hypothetical protein